MTLRRRDTRTGLVPDLCFILRAFVRWPVHQPLSQSYHSWVKVAFSSFSSSFSWKSYSNLPLLYKVVLVQVVEDYLGRRFLHYQGYFFQTDVIRIIGGNKRLYLLTKFPQSFKSNAYHVLSAQFTSLAGYQNLFLSVNCNHQESTRL